MLVKSTLPDCPVRLITLPLMVKSCAANTLKSTELPLEILNELVPAFQLKL